MSFDTISYDPLFNNHQAHEGKIRWSRGKPIVTPRYIVSDGAEQEVIDAINAAPRDPSSPDSYSKSLYKYFRIMVMNQTLTTLFTSGLVFVHGWSENLNHMKTVNDGLASDVRVVTPKAMADLIQRNVLPDTLMSDTFDGGLADWTTSGDVTATASAEAKLALDGYMERSVTTSDYYSIRVEFDLTAIGFETGDVLNVDIDYGSSGSWETIMTIEASMSEADGNMHSLVHNLPSSADDDSITLRFGLLQVLRRSVRGRVLGPKCASSDQEAKVCSGAVGNLPKNCCDGLVCSGDVCIVDPTPAPSNKPTASPTLTMSSEPTSVS